MRSATKLAGLALAGTLCGATTARADVEVLGERTAWRFSMTFRPFGGQSEKVLPPRRTRWVRWGETLAAPLPPTDWQTPGFPDDGWPRRRGPFLEGYGGGRYTGTAVICLRARFGVDDPRQAKGLKLDLAYRGGAVVYLNGREIARGHMPDGKLDLLTAAAAYPREVYVTPDGEAMLPDYGRRKPPADVLGRYEARIRRTSVELPPDALRAGTNVLALELHRVEPPTDLPLGGRELNWETVGLLEARLTAPAGSGVKANPSPADEAKVQVWTATPLLRVGVDADYADPFEPAPPVRLTAPINGFSSGQVVVTAPAGRKGFAYPQVTPTDLKGPGGRSIPSSAVRIRYARPSGEFTALFDTPEDLAGAVAPISRYRAEPDGNAPQHRPVWVTVQVPPEAAPGRYAGELKLTGPDVAARVPVELTVHGWRLGEPRDWRCCVNLLQSPESVAGHYKVPLWSDRHFELLARSLEWMGRAGNDVLGISAVGRSVFGNDPLVVFRKEGGQWVPELKYLQRYLALYDRHAGRPQLLSVHVWSYGMYYRGAGRDGTTKEIKSEWRAKTIPIVELRDGSLRDATAPIYGEPGSEAMWRAAMEGIRAIVVKLGWGEGCILLGTSGDGWVGPRTVGFFKEIAPYARWRAITHGSGVPRWGPTEADRTQPNGMAVGYLELARRISNSRHRSPAVPITCNSRDCVGRDPFQYRSLPGTNVLSANFDGICWKGLDYWTYLAPDGSRRSALNADVHFGNIVGGTPREMLQPGPDGAVATAQYEMLREGIQDCEAMILLRDALNNKPLRAKLGDELAARCEAVLEDLLALLETGGRYHPHGGGDVRHHVERLYAAAAEVSRAIGGRS